MLTLSLVSLVRRIILAADELSLQECLELVAKLGDRVHAIKIHDIFDEHGPQVVRQLLDSGAPRVWVDAKLHDIPKTVERRAKAIAKSGAEILSVHASGEVDMMEAAVQAGPPTIFAVTVLTSHTEEQAHLTYGQPSKAGALYYARLAKLAGVQGVVCSPKEVGILAKRPELGGLRFITPGVRSPGKSVDDQKRVDTPVKAFELGASYIVVGRQVTLASDPSEALAQIEQEISSVVVV